RERGVELGLDERAHLLCLHVVRVVVTRGERVRPEYHAALPLGAEALPTSAAIRLEQIRPFDARAVAHAVVAREVRGGFGWLDDVVDREPVVGEREAHLDDVRALTFELAKRVPHGLLDTELHPLDEELLRYADAQALHTLGEVAPQVLSRERHRRRVVRILAEQRLADDRRVLDGMREGSDLIERRRERDDAVPRHAAV